MVHTEVLAFHVSVFDEFYLIHKIVNRKYHFKNPTDSIHTNTIEGSNKGLKHIIKPINHTKKIVNDWLFYFI